MQSLEMWVRVRAQRLRGCRGNNHEMCILDGVRLGLKEPPPERMWQGMGGTTEGAGFQLSSKVKPSCNEMQQRIFR